jgi:3-oxoacyl-[acyl-carrier-protein] synthase-3
MTRAAVLTSLGTALPPRVVTNEEIAQRLDTSDEWIRTRTGITQRHVVDPGTATSDLAVEAAAQVLNGTEGGIDLVVLATTTPDQPCPATAPTVAARLGLGTVPAYDIAAVCSGFVYALAAGAGAIAAGIADRVLVIGAETFTSIINPADRTTAPIFGDGAGAVVLRAGTADEPGALHGFDLGSDGTLASLIQVPAGGSRQRSSGRPAEKADTYFAMAGKQVFKAAVQRMAESSRAVLDRTGWTAESVDWLVGHQANVRILHAVADSVGVPAEKAVVNLDRVGNTSAASIPLALADAAADGRLRAGQRILLTAFGGGATWGSVSLTWPELKTSPTSTTLPTATSTAATALQKEN